MLERKLLTAIPRVERLIENVGGYHRVHVPASP